jgi:ribose transport system substrate-binding protein
MIFLTQSNVPAVVTLGEGVKQAATAVGWNFSQINYDPADPATLQQALSTALIKHPTAISMSGTDPSQIGASMLAAYSKAHIPIIDSSSAIAKLAAPVIGNVGGGATYQQYAKALAAWFVVDSGGKGKAILASTQGLAIFKTYADAFVAEVKTLCSACDAKLIPVPFAAAAGGQTNQRAISALRSNPGYKYLIYDNGGFATGINSAFAAAGLNDVKVGGSDFHEEQATALASGKQAAWTGLNMHENGYTIMDIALRYVEGMPIDQDNSVQPTQIVTKANIGKMSVFDQPSDSLAQWKKLWHVN